MPLLTGCGADARPPGEIVSVATKPKPSGSNRLTVVSRDGDVPAFAAALRACRVEANAVRGSVSDAETLRRALAAQNDRQTITIDVSDRNRRRFAALRRCLAMKNFPQDE